MRALQHLIVTLVVAVASASSGAAQESGPLSLTDGVASMDAIDHRILAPVDVAALLAEDARPADRPRPFRVAQPVPLDADLWDDGSIDSVPGGVVWRLRVTSPGAVFLSFKLSEVQLSPGASLYFLSVDRDFEAGPFTNEQAPRSRRLGSPMLPGDSAVIELYLPTGVAACRLVVESVSHGYRDVMGMGSFPRRGDGAEPEQKGGGSGGGGAFGCQRDISCPEGAAYQDEERASAEGYTGQYTCSGQMINNVREDNRYLYLTAEHCEFWRDPEGMAYYFNYENSACGASDAPFEFSLGSTELFRTFTGDLDLLELDGPDLEGRFDVYFLGWDSSNVAPSEGATIGYPDDKPKQIAIDLDPLTDCATSSCFNGFGPNFWRVDGWDVGVTEVGSSGSMLLDQSHLLVGVLSGGVGSNCNNFEWDEYAKIATEWAGLSPFLDPDSTGVVSLPGRDGSAPPPLPPVGTPYGASTSGSLGPPTMEAAGLLQPDTPLLLKAGNLPTSTAAFLALSVKAKTPPLDLSNGLLLNVALPLVQLSAAVANSSGQAVLQFHLPPQSLGLSIYAQAIVLDGVGGTDFCSSNGLRLDLP